MTPWWPQPTRANHAQFVRVEGWRSVPSSDHETFELNLADGRVLRTRISRPPNKTTYGPRIWAHILHDQLDVTQGEFWACVRDGQVPVRGPDEMNEGIGGAIPAEIVTLLVERVGITRSDFVGMTKQETIERLNEYWTSGR